MVVKYKDYVRVIGIYRYKSENVRYWIRYQLDNRALKNKEITNNKEVVFILQNPSEADHNKSDRTINKVLDFCHHENRNKVTIFNLSPIYGTKSNTISTAKLAKYSKHNMIALIWYICAMKISDIVLAWGDCDSKNTGYHKTFFKKEQQKYLRLLKYLSCKYHINIYCVSSKKDQNPLTKKRNPRHFGYFFTADKLERCKISRNNTNYELVT